MSKYAQAVRSGQLRIYWVILLGIGAAGAAAIFLLCHRPPPPAPAEPAVPAVAQTEPADAPPPLPPESSNAVAEASATNAPDMVAELLENANTATRPPENILANPTTPDSDYQGRVAKAEAESAAANALFRKSARAQHDLLEAVRAVYKAHPELVRDQARITELFGELQAQRRNAKPYQDALAASRAAAEAYRRDVEALHTLTTNSPAAAHALPPDRQTLEAEVVAHRAALEATVAQAAAAQRALTNAPAWQQTQAEIARLQQSVQTALARDEKVQSLKQLCEQLERQQQEARKERFKEPAKVAVTR
jgi:hypothetical protein